MMHAHEGQQRLAHDPCAWGLMTIMPCACMRLGSGGGSYVCSTIMSKWVWGLRDDVRVRSRGWHWFCISVCVWRSTTTDALRMCDEGELSASSAYACSEGWMVVSWLWEGRRRERDDALCTCREGANCGCEGKKGERQKLQVGSWNK